MSPQRMDTRFKQLSHNHNNKICLPPLLMNKVTTFQSTKRTHLKIKRKKKGKIFGKVLNYQWSLDPKDKAFQLEKNVGH